eukprot:1157325-Pelagomonas_calceolata.AAC.13
MEQDDNQQQAACAHLAEGPAAAAAPRPVAPSTCPEPPAGQPAGSAGTAAAAAAAELRRVPEPQVLAESMAGAGCAAASGLTGTPRLPPAPLPLSAHCCCCCCRVHAP